MFDRVLNTLYVLAKPSAKQQLINIVFNVDFEHVHTHKEVSPK